MRVAIVGGGVVGLCCAYELCHLGCDVTLIDAAEVGQGASQGNAGWITPFLSAPRAEPGATWNALKQLASADSPTRIIPRIDPRFATWLWRFWRSTHSGRFEAGTRSMLRLSAGAVAAYDRLAISGIPLEMHHDGLFVVTLSEATLEHFVQRYKVLRQLGYEGEAEVLSGQAAREFEPAVSDEVFGGMYLPAEAHVRPESVSRGVARWLKDGHATVREGCVVNRIIPARGETWAIHISAEAPIVADRLVLAAGMGSKQLLAPLRIALPLEPASGTSLTMAPSSGAPRRPMKMAERMVACSPFNGAVRISGTFDLGRFSAAVNTKRLDSVVRGAGHYLRSIPSASGGIRWAGLRPVTPDDLPIIGPVPGWPGLYLVTGFGSLGMTLGPISAQVLAPVIRGDSIPYVLEPFLIERFGSRSTVSAATAERMTPDG